VNVIIHLLTVKQNSAENQ